MTLSMTAFSRQQQEQEWGSLTWEIRSVNHRYLEANVRLPESFRALENAVPIVRCTMDGHSVAVDAGGRVVAGLAIAPAPQLQARFLEVSIERAAGRTPPMAWLRRSCGWALALFTALGAAHSVFRWFRIRSARTARSAGVTSGSCSDSPGGS